MNSNVFLLNQLWIFFNSLLVYYTYLCMLGPEQTQEGGWIGLLKFYRTITSLTNNNATRQANLNIQSAMKINKLS